MLGPGCFLLGLLCLNLMCEPMMYWNHHIKELFIWAGAASLRVACCLCIVCVGGGGRGSIFFGELRVSAVWILQAVAEGINRLSLSFYRSFFRDWTVHRGSSVTDVCLCYASIYLFRKPNALLTRHCYPLSVFSVCIIVFLQVQMSWVAAKPQL